MDHIDREMRFLLYHDAEDDVAVNAAVLNESIWVTQKAMAELFDVDRSVITKHLANIYESEELLQEATCAKIALVQTEGTRQVKCWKRNNKTPE